MYIVDVVVNIMFLVNFPLECKMLQIEYCYQDNNNGTYNLSSYPSDVQKNLRSFLRDHLDAEMMSGLKEMIIVVEDPQAVNAWLQED